jgi:hypothetical protein
MSLYSTSAKKFGSTHVAFGFLMGRVSFDFGLTTVSSCFLISLETVRDHGTDLAHVDKVIALLFAKVQSREPRCRARRGAGPVSNRITAGRFMRLPPVVVFGAGRRPRGAGTSVPGCDRARERDGGCG